MFDDIFDKVITKNWEAFTTWVQHFFTTPFAQMVEWTGLAFLVALFLAYFFPALRTFAGAVVISLAAAWYGFAKGREGMVKKPPAKKRR